MEVSVERVMALKMELAGINATPLDKITFTEGGIPLQIPQQCLEDFKYTGLNNVDFIMTNFYKEYASWLEQHRTTKP